MKIPNSHKKQFGFTLIELAVALTIVALIIGSLAVPLSTRLSEQQYVDTQANIDKAVEALYGFAITNRRLPCPDVSTALVDNRDGLEKTTLNPAAAVNGCNAGFTGIQSQADGASWGDLPWRTLGLQAPAYEDAWNNRLRYAVFTPLTLQANYAGAIPPAPTNCVAGPSFSNINCQTVINGITAALDLRCANPTAPPGTPAPGCLLSIPAGAATNFVISNNAVFVVYSHGANEWGSTNVRDLTATKPFSAAGTPSDDRENIPESQGVGNTVAQQAARKRFVMRERSNRSSNAGEFDDVLVYVSANTLAAKLLAAGVWP